MPAAASSNTVARQWELLKLLPGRAPGLTARDICQRLRQGGHDVSKRTVERDLAVLENIFALHCNQRGKPYGWYWPQDRAPALPGIAVSEALTLGLMEEYIRPLVPAVMLEGLEPRFAHARQKLEALAEENPSARWLSKVASVHPTMPLMAPQLNATVVETVQRALLEDAQLACCYYSAHSDKTADHVLNPLGLVQRGQVTYLVATADPHKDVRLFAMHRVLSAQQLEQACLVPEGFSLTAYVESEAMAFGTPIPIKLKARVSAALARLISETPLSEDMLVEGEGEQRLLTATVKDTWQLRWWALSHAGSLVVLEPDSLKQSLLRQLQKATKMYTTDMPIGG